MQVKNTTIIFFGTFLLQFLLLHGIPIVNVGELFFAIQVSKGYVLYSEIFSHHGPALPYMFGLLFHLIKPSPLFLEIVNYLTYSILCVLIYKISQFILSEKQSLLPPFLFIIISRIFDSQLFYPDIYAILLSALSIYLILKYPYSTKILVIIGVMTAISTLFKQNIGIFTLASILIYIIIDKKTTRQPVILILTNAAVFLFAAGYFYSKNTLPEFIHDLVIFNFSNVAQLYKLSCSPTSPIFLTLIIGLLGIISSRTNKTLFLLSIWTLLGSIVMYPVCYNQHLILTLVPFSIIVVCLTSKVTHKKLILILVLITSATFISEVYRDYNAVQSLKKSDTDPWYAWIQYDNDLVRYLNTIPQSERIYSIPTDFSIYISSNRDTIPLYQVNDMYFTDESQKEIILQLEDYKVKYIVIQKSSDPYPCSPLIYQHVSKNHSIVNFDRFILLEPSSNYLNISTCQQGQYIYSMSATNNTITFDTRPRTISDGYYMKILKQCLK